MPARRLATALFALGMVMSLEGCSDAVTPPPADAVQLARAGAVLLDVRTREEWDEGHIQGARFAPWQALDASSPALPADKATPIVTYCRSGARAQRAAQKLRELGYTRVVALEHGGFAELAAAGMQVEK